MLRFKNRRHPVWRDRYTALFFLDEVTALRGRSSSLLRVPPRGRKAFAEKWAQAKGGAVPHAPEMDVVLQAERLDGRAKRTHDLAIDDLPDGAVLTLPESPAPRSRCAAHTCCAGARTAMSEKIARPRGVAKVLTPPSIVACRSVPAIRRNGIRRADQL